jgi:hypothetical protein
VVPLSGNVKTGGTKKRKLSGRMVVVMSPNKKPLSTHPDLVLVKSLEQAIHPFIVPFTTISSNLGFLFAIEIPRSCHCAA